MAAAPDLQKQCHELLNKLKTNQATLKQSLNLDKENQPSSLENNLQTRRAEQKPEYARQKLKSIMKNGKSVGSDGTRPKSGSAGDKSRTSFRERTITSALLAQSSSKDSEVTVKSRSGKSGKSTLIQGEQKFDALPDNDAMQDYFESRTSSSFMEGGKDSFLGAVSTEDNTRPQPSAKPLTPNSVRRRRIIDQNVHVESKLSAADLQELERNVRGLNFSYSEALADDDTFGKSGQEQHTADSQNNSATAEQDAKEASLAYHKSLLDGGNNRQLNNFIKDTTIKPKSLLNSTQSYSSSYSKQV